jgi:pimeloyl-ACP methyl ester carboxylesterase
MLRYVVEGEGATVLLIHGFALDARMWAPQLAALRGGFRVVTVDLPDFGPAPVSVGPHSAARAIADVLDAVDGAPAHVVGQSLGGAVAVDLALAFRARVRSLTLVDALLLGRASGIRGYADAAAHARAGEMDRARAAWLGDDLYAAARARPEVFAAVRAMAADYAGEHWRGRASTIFEVNDPAPRLAELDLPALVLCGALDLPTFRAMADEYASRLPRATRHEIAGAGHLANLEAPEAVNGHLLRFLAR